jgi:hypothetical protein
MLGGPFLFSALLRAADGLGVNRDESVALKGTY